MGTSGYVKLLLPPRQSRGASLGRLVVEDDEPFHPEALRRAEAGVSASSA